MLAPRSADTKIAHETIDCVERIFDAHRGDGRESIGERLDDGRFFSRRAAVGERQRSDIPMRRAGECAGREHQDEIDAEALPIDGAQIGDARGDSAAEDVDRDGLPGFSFRSAAVLSSSETCGAPA